MRKGRAWAMAGVYVEVIGDGHAWCLERMEPNQCQQTKIIEKNEYIRTPSEHPRGQNQYVVLYAYSQSTVNAGNSSAN